MSTCPESMAFSKTIEKTKKIKNIKNCIQILGEIIEETQKNQQKPWMLLEMLCSTGCKDCGSLSISMCFLVFLGFFNDFSEYLHMILDFCDFLGFRNGFAYPLQEVLC